VAATTFQPWKYRAPMVSTVAAPLARRLAVFGPRRRSRRGPW
jgi:hypothetical protein